MLVLTLGYFPTDAAGTDSWVMLWICTGAGTESRGCCYGFEPRLVLNGRYAGTAGKELLAAKSRILQTRAPPEVGCLPRYA
eukprot:1008724-Rhodomonas_salina.1